MSQPKPGETLCILSWADAHDRLDTLILEIRHLQTNIIDSLREPLLYRPLRYEESHIWPGATDAGAAAASPASPANPAAWSDGWGALLLRRDITASALADAWVIRYPRPADFGGATDLGPSGNARSGAASCGVAYPGLDAASGAARLAICRAVSRRMRRVWQQRIWSLDQNRHYHVLRALQILKSNVVKDKVTLTYWGLRAFGEPLFMDGTGLAEPEQRREQARFILLRAAVLARAWR